jgi:xylose isomerase
VNPKAAFFLVKFLEEVHYDGSRHFDAHAYRTEDYEGVKDFARGCMRTYLILKEKACKWNHDPEIKAVLQEIASTNGDLALPEKLTAEKLAEIQFDRAHLAQKKLPYEKLDQLTMDVLFGVR